MKQITLTRGHFALVDDEDYEYLNQWSWISIRARKSDIYYAVRQIRINKKIKLRYMHREILRDKSTNKIDHKNRNGLDNRKENLRICTNSQNACNQERQKNNTSGYKGVSFEKKRNKWNAQIMKNGKRHNLGYYITAIEAARAYNKKALELHGEFARINPI